MTDPQVSLTNAVDSLAEVTGCPIVVEDSEYRVIAYSAVPGQASDPARDAAILRRRTPDAWLQWATKDEVGRAVDESDDLHMVREPFPGLGPRQVKAIKQNGEVIGYLWILQGERGFPPNLREEIDLFERYSVREIARLSGTEERGAESHFVRHFLTGTVPVADLPAMVGVQKTWVVVATLFTTLRSGYMDRKELRQVDTLGRLQYPGSRRHVVQMGLLDKGLCRLDFFEPGIDDRQHAAATLRSARAVQKSIPGPLYVGMGSTCALSDAQNSWTEARIAAEFLQFQDAGGMFAEFRDVQAKAALLAIHRFMASRPELFDGVTAALEMDSAGSSLELKKMLAQYLLAGGSVARAAATLNLHPNSLRYRLERVRKLLPWDLNDPLDRLMLQLSTLDTETWPLSGTSLR